MATENVLDLRSSGSLSIEDAKRIDELEPQVRQAFNDYMAQLVAANRLSGIDLFLKVTCRNTILSQLLDHMCKMALLEDKLSKGEPISAIKVDTPTLTKPIAQLLQKYDVAQIPFSCEGRLPGLLKNTIKNFVISVYGVLSDLFWSRLYYRRKRPEGPVTLVDTFIFTYSFDKPGPFIDRFYIGHEAYLTEKQRKQRCYTPTLIGVREPADYKKLFTGLAKTDATFLMQESWCTPVDYLVALYQSFMLPFKIKQIPLAQGLDYSDLIRHEAKADRFAFSLVKTIGKYRFIKQLAKAKVEIYSAVDWFENQVGDRAFNVGMKTFYPEVKVHGYQGYSVPGFYACTQPQPFEKALGSVPDVFHVINTSQLQTRKQAYEGIEVELAPAFRFSYLYDIERKPTQRKLILVALPIMVEESQKLVRSTIGLLDALEHDVEVVVKHHPSLTPERFVELVPEAADPRLSITRQSMPELLQQVTLLISSTSSACLEAIALGVPVAVMGNWSGVTMNPIPSTIDPRLWCVFYSTEQLNLFISQVLQQEPGPAMVNALFQAVEEQNTKALFQCPK